MDMFFKINCLLNVITYYLEPNPDEPSVNIFETVQNRHTLYNNCTSSDLCYEWPSTKSSCSPLHSAVVLCSINLERMTFELPYDSLWFGKPCCPIFLGKHLTSTLLKIKNVIWSYFKIIYNLNFTVSHSGRLCRVWTIILKFSNVMWFKVYELIVGLMTSY